MTKSRLFRRFLLIIFLLLLICGGLAWHNGLRPHNYKEFFSGLFALSDTAATDSLPQAESPSGMRETEAARPQKMKSSGGDLQPLPPDPYAKIDRYARNCPSSAEKTIASLAAHLQKPANNDLEKARAIYVWLTDNVRYDDDGYNSGDYSDTSAEGVLKNRKAVCEGFSNLFLALGREMGLPVRKVSGYAKGYGYQPGERFSGTDHAWNVIRIDGRWRIFDATWGQGNGIQVNGKLVTKSEFDPYWFNVDPYEAVFTHLPENARNAMVKPAIDLRTYERMIYLRPACFKLGFNGAEVYRHIRKDPRLRLPSCYCPDTYVRMLAGPKNGVLSLGKTYRFEFEIPRGLEVAVIDPGGTWTRLAGKKGRFSVEATPELPGEMQIALKYDKGGSWHRTIMVYQVKENGPMPL